MDLENKLKILNEKVKTGFKNTTNDWITHDNAIKE